MGIFASRKRRRDHELCRHPNHRELPNFASLNPETPTQVWVETEGDSYLVVTLNKHTPQYTTNVVFSDQDVKISVKGAGEVHITGTFQIDGMLDSDDEELDDDDLMAEYPSSSGDEEGDHPAYAGTRRIEMLEESSSSEEPIPVQTKKQKVAPPAPQPAKPAQQPGQQGGSSKKKNKKKKNNQG